jgi:hypothetical protein
MNETYSKIRQLDEASLVRLYQHTVDRNIGIVTAFRGRYPLPENRKRNGQLVTDIRAAGFGYYKLQGHYIEGYKTDKESDVHEEVFFIIGDKGNDNGKLKGFLKKAGAKYNQDSILYKQSDNKNAMLIGTQGKDEDGNPVSFPGMGKEVSVGEFKPMKFGEFYSKMRGRTFVFESYGEQMSWMEAYAEYIRLKSLKGA